MKRLKVLMYFLLGLIVVGGVGYYVHTADWSVQIQKKAAKQKKKRKIAAKKKKIKHRVAKTHFVKTKASNQQVTKLLALTKFVGTALVVKNGHVIYHKGFGYADEATGQPNTPLSKYQILSIQKSLTAACVMRLVQAGKINLNDPLSKYYPGIAGGKKITLRRMLDMDSGLTFGKGSSQALSEARVIDYAVENLNSDPAKMGQWNYQPVNYVLLAGIIRQVTGESYRRYFTQHIINALQLKHTGFVSAGQGQHGTQGYKYSGSQVVATYHTAFHETTAQMANELGTGQIYMSAGDLFKAEKAILTGKVVTPQNVAILHTAATSSTYGGGVYNMANAIRSHGIGYGYESSIMLSDDGKNGVVLLSNYYRPTVTIQTTAEKLFNELEAGNLK
ncbi:serine hydrolase domain-containing protein [Lactiplantibacillus mudanjiangensis]|uniref:Peptidase S12 [Lactobacillus sp.] n=1 Tax=Lactiplantibacillus mudanjiangensis TaxID=1296538 RepID=A0A660E8A4_9LACO|nr:serine hydrolase domain-containing protein [Lactiplantibacillus mudanjiangensis]VDG20568.1 peptidase S12 [Lactobacillus sp.] [Lactiplantibacillus mudanjiangensis]VDG24558.1 peptidase S12 [Lactobacillus sp.] [Lactiplantibacillus mudanjiangensis]VDG28607.1 peptidase S12 [Lactobacillus sp.] [Lactiplantibacillus mudanjiangensis]VDG30694.1 peptidase S12 [Lactobacillus sp.] [Lactiplantibacillus mudanjiangensis]